jgi:hypothetical protein
MAGRWSIRHPVIRLITLLRFSPERYPSRIIHRFFFSGIHIKEHRVRLSDAGCMFYRKVNHTELPIDMPWPRKPGEDRGEIEGSASPLPSFIDRKPEVSAI